MVTWIIFMTVYSSYESEEIYSFNQGDFIKFDSGWSYYDEEGALCSVNPESGIPNDETGTITVVNQLPEEINGQSAIVYFGGRYDMTVIIDGEVRYTYGYNKSKLFGMPEATWHVIRLNQEDANKDLQIQIHSYFNESPIILSNIYLGDGASIAISLLKTQWFGIVTSMMLLALSIFLLVIWILTRRKYKMNSILFLSMFSTLIFIWSFSETHIMNFFMPNQTGITIVVFEVLAIIPLPILMFLEYYVEKRRNKYVKIAMGSTILVFIICNMLHCLGIRHLVQTLSIVHINYVFCCALIPIFYAWNQTDQNKNSTYIIIALSVLFVSFVADMVRYYTLDFADYSLFTRIGIFLFVVILGIDAVERNVQMRFLAQKAKLFRMLAYHDSLTGVGNRTAFDEKMSELNYQDETKEDTMVVIADTNDLKYINDHFGHHVGDEYIISASNILKECFEEIGAIYRTGGDEFTVLIPDCQEEQFQMKLECMDDLLSRQEEITSGRPIFSYGYARYDGTREVSLQKTIHRADSKMYDEKHVIKEKYKIAK